MPSNELLPASWSQVDANRSDLREGVTPRDLQAAAEQADTLYDVTVILRTQRTETRLALNRLGLLEELRHPPDCRGQVLSLGGDQVDV